MSNFQGETIFSWRFTAAQSPSSSCSHTQNFRNLNAGFLLLFFRTSGVGKFQRSSINVGLWWCEKSFWFWHNVWGDYETFRIKWEESKQFNPNFFIILPIRVPKSPKFLTSSECYIDGAPMELRWKFSTTYAGVYLIRKPSSRRRGIPSVSSFRIPSSSYIVLFQRIVHYLAVWCTYYSMIGNVWASQCSFAMCQCRGVSSELQTPNY